MKKLFYNKFKGIISSSEFSDNLIKIYNLHKIGKIKKPQNLYNSTRPNIIFIKQSIDAFICYGKRFYSFRWV